MGTAPGFLSSKESKQGGRVEVARPAVTFVHGQKEEEEENKGKGKFPNNPLGFEKIK